MFNHLLPIIQNNSHPGWISSQCEMTDYSSFFAECPLASLFLFKRPRPCITCVECKDTLDRVSQQTSIHAYDCFVCWAHFSIHRGAGRWGRRNEPFLCQQLSVVIWSSARKINALSIKETMRFKPWWYCTHRGMHKNTTVMGWYIFGKKIASTFSYLSVFSLLSLPAIIFHHVQHSFIWAKYLLWCATFNLSSLYFLF